MRHGRSVFDRRGRGNKLTTDEKPDIVEFVLALGLDLTIHEDTATPYLNGPCPLGHHENNQKTFIVYPAIQKCECRGSCSTGYMDVIDLYRNLYNCDYETARLNICTPISQEQSLLKQLQKDVPNSVDLRVFAERAHFLFDRLDFDCVQPVLKKIHVALADGQPSLADQLLRRHGV